MKVQAQDLKFGDRIPGRYGCRIVTRKPSRGVDTPRGKVDVAIDGTRYTWGATTEIDVERGEQ